MSMFRNLLMQNRSWTGKPADWSDIRKDCPANSIALYAGHTADYSQYDNLGFTATCTGGYNVFIDGVQYGTTYTSGAQCFITWSTSGITTGDNITTPSALKAHKIWIIPATSGNNITKFIFNRVAGSVQEEQGLLWAHFNIDNAINLGQLTANSSTVWQKLCEAITAKNNVINVTAANHLTRGIPDIEYLPIIDFGGNNALFNYIASNLTKLKTITLKNAIVTNADSAFANSQSLENIKLSNVTVNYSGNNPSVTALFQYDYNLKKIPAVFKEINSDNITLARSYLQDNDGLIEDTVIDASNANSLTRISCNGSADHFMTKFKGLRVSSSSPLNNATAPQINVSYTGMDRGALVQLFNDLPTVTDGQIINITACTGSSDLTPQDVDIAVNKGWTIVGGINPAIVSGATSISLPNAAEDTLQYVKAFGGITQNGLPLDYTLLEYIQTTGTQYINNIYSPTNNTELEVTFIPTATSGNYIANASSGTVRYGFYYDGTWRYSIGGDSMINSRDSTDYAVDQEITVKMNNTGFYVNNTLVGSTVNPDPFTTDPAIVLARGSGKAKWKTLKIKESGVLVKNLIPAKRNSDSVSGMYDTVSNTFLTNDGTGSFTNGSDYITPSTPIDIVSNNGVLKVNSQGQIYADGTVETITDNLGNTATAEMLLKVDNYKDTQEVISGTVTRNVGVKVLTGTENWQVSGSKLDLFLLSTGIDTVNLTTSMCNYYVGVPTDTSTSNIQSGQFKYGYSTSLNRIYIVDNTYYNDLAGFKTFLQGRFAAGNPVIIVYPLATAITETVTGQTLQVKSGSNTIAITQSSVNGLELEAKYYKEN